VRVFAGVFNGFWDGLATILLFVCATVACAALVVGTVILGMLVSGQIGHLKTEGMSERKVGIASIIVGAVVVVGALFISSRMSF
jgi:hypothetical protein